MHNHYKMALLSPPVPVISRPFTQAVFPEEIFAAVAVDDVWEARLAVVTVPPVVYPAGIV